MENLSVIPIADEKSPSPPTPQGDCGNFFFFGGGNYKVEREIFGRTKGARRNTIHWIIPSRRWFDAEVGVKFILCTGF
jgi:hypothetical protein